MLLDKACVMLLAGHASNITHVFDPKTSVISFTASLLDSDNDEMWLVATVTECKRAARMILNCSTQPPHGQNWAPGSALLLHVNLPDALVMKSTINSWTGTRVIKHEMLGKIASSSSPGHCLFHPLGL